MRKIMIIDDDVPMLRYLEKMISWEELGLQVVATVFSSIKALEVFREKAPDIIITDIGMPQMDGIELASRVKEINPDVRIVFLTCHEDFGYARSAVQLQADDYLIKDELTPQKLISSLQKASKLAGESKERIDQLSFREELEHHKDQIKKQLWRQLSSKVDRAKLTQSLSKIGKRWDFPQYMLATATVDYASVLQHYRYEDMNLIHYACYNIAEEMAQGMSDITIIPQEQVGKFVFLLNYRANLAVNTHQVLESYLYKLCAKVKDFLKVTMRFLISDELDGLEQIKAANERLTEQQLSLYYSQWASSNKVEAASNVLWTVNDYDLKRYKDELLLAYEKNDLNALEQVLERMEHTAKNLLLKPSLFCYHLSQMLRALEYELNVNDEKNHFHSVLQHTSSSQEAVLLAKQHLSKISGIIAGNRKEVVKEPRLQEINEYISKHLTENISSVSVANHLFLNPSYFSRYFKKIAGVNFTEYVHRYKMGVAKQLFETGETVEFVAIQLGYSDRTYFSKVFKKYIGMSPIDFKSIK